jgi:N,N-dimethylformamidase
MRLVGYSNRLSVAPGESIAFMVSSAHPTYDAEIVRLVHGDPNSLGPGIIEQVVDTPVNGRYEGRIQSIHTGSNITVKEGPSLRITGSFTIQAWIFPTTPGKEVQGLVTKWSHAAPAGCALVISDGALALWLADGARSARWRRRPPAGENLVLHRRDLRCRDK